MLDPCIDGCKINWYVLHSGVPRGGAFKPPLKFRTPSKIVPNST